MTFIRTTLSHTDLSKVIISRMTFSIRRTTLRNTDLSKTALRRMAFGRTTLRNIALS